MNNEKTTTRVRYYSGLDLGGVQDYTALAVLEKSTPVDRRGEACGPGSYALRHLERFVPGTPYTEVCARLAALFAQAPLRDSLLGVDQTGVGKPVFDLVRK